MVRFIRSYFARRRFGRQFGDYLSPDAVRRLIETGGEPLSAPADVELTPFFASLHAYVSLAEQLSLVQLREVLGSYFDRCLTEIEAAGGTIDKLVGDAIVAMFGAPVPMPDHAMQACLAALKCQERIGELRAQLQRDENRWPAVARQLRVRIGLHTGSAIVGNMGSATRMSYTMMGDTVNLAARMEKGAKSYGVWTLCTDVTRRACDQADNGRIVFRPLGCIVVKGRAEPLEVFEPLGLRGTISEQVRECTDLFAAGLERWRQRDWDGAIRFFEQSARLERDQPEASGVIKGNPSAMYLRLAETYRADPSAVPWFV